MTDISTDPIFYWHQSPGNSFWVDVADFDEAAECPYCVPVYPAGTVDRLRARVAELEAAKGEPVGKCTQYLLGSDCPTQKSCRENGCSAIGRRDYTAPRVDVDAISETALRCGAHAIYKLTEFAPTPDEMRAALRAIFNDDGKVGG